MVLFQTLSPADMRARPYLGNVGKSLHRIAPSAFTPDCQPAPLTAADLQALAPTPATLEGLRLRPADMARLVGGKPVA